MKVLKMKPDEEPKKLVEEEFDIYRHYEEER